jgi:hypothetical protein
MRMQSMTISNESLMISSCKAHWLDVEFWNSGEALLVSVSNLVYCSDFHTRE